MYTMLFSMVWTKKLFTKADGSYAHTTIDDASYKAYSDELSWLLRANSSALSSLGGGNLMANLSVYSATVTEENGKAKVTVIAFMPTEDIIAETGSLEDGIKEIIQNILPDKTAIEISWTEGGSVNLSFMGMSTDDMSLVDALIEKLGNVSLFGENSDMEKAALSVKDCFDDNFIVGIEDGKGYVCMPDFYELIRRNVFSPNKPGKEQVSRGDVYALFKTLYERPETNGVFDSAIVGYENKPEDVEKIAKPLARPHGIILVTGPTGSGKSTTLTAFIRRLRSPEIRIITVEDPWNTRLKA